MREIKFKVFNKNEKNYLFDKIEIKTEILVNILNLTLTDDSELILQQFTGLTDKNNVEIYEGDIIKAKIGAMDFIFKVEFEHGKFMAVESDDDELTAFDLFTITDKCEVVGNIHENPELLK